MPSKTDRRIEYLPLHEVEPATRNPKQHDLAGVRRSIARFGFAAPALRDERTGRLVVGHGRTEVLAAMRDAGEHPPVGVGVADDGSWLVPVVCGWSSASDTEAEAYLVADNQHTIAAGWDNETLGTLLADIVAADPDILETTGFTPADLDAFLAGSAPDPPRHTDPDDVPARLPEEPVSRLGDVWLLGSHRLVCGDARDPAVVAKAVGGRRMNVVFSSPPYAMRRVYDEASGFTPIDPDAYVDWFEAVQANIGVVLADDGSWLLNIKEHCDDGQRDLYVKDLVLAHVRRWGWLFVDEFCWVDTNNGVPGGWPNRFKDAWEPVFHFARQKAIKFDAMVNATESDAVFDSSPNNTVTPGSGLLNKPAGGKREGLARPSNVVSICSRGDQTHPAQFPVALPAWFIRVYSDLGDAVLDPFAGSGSTLIAAHGEGRVGHAIEISPAYCDLICTRYQRHTGGVPVLEATGEARSFIDPEGGASDG